MEGITTIIFVHCSINKDRGELGIRSFKDLYESVKKERVEMIVIDNGGSLKDSQFFLGEAHKGRITHYIRNSDNLFFGHGRNQGIALSIGEYICIVDNDLIYKEGWLPKCIDVLKATKGKKLFVTPLEVDRAHRFEKYWGDNINIKGKEYQVNTMAGSNCWIMHREDYEKVGPFVNHRISGTKWCQKYSRLGFKVVAFIKPMAQHEGLKNTKWVGYSKRGGIRIDKFFINGDMLTLFPWR